MDINKLLDTDDVLLSEIEVEQLLRFNKSLLRSSAIEAPIYLAIAPDMAMALHLVIKEGLEHIRVNNEN